MKQGMKKLSSFITLSFFCLNICAQTIPMDTAIRYGKLDNGLTYYIRHNEEPKQRGSFYIVQNVGAILEEDNQNGLAHFLEHMAFNGTKNFPGKGIIRYMESIGAQFGTNVNAYTSLDETVYMLRDIPVLRQSIVDSALLILHDWSSFISLEEKEIDNERGVILEEWRTGANANRRMWKEGNKLKYPGSQYAKRDVIGDTAVINNFSYQELKDYYHKWYRPDLQAIIIVGDVDVDAVEKSIFRIFADIAKAENAATRVLHSIPDNDTPIISIVTDPEATISMLGIEYKHPALSNEIKRTEQGYMLSLANSLIASMLNERFAKAKENPQVPFVEFYAYYGDISKMNDAFQVYLIAKEGREKEAFELLLKEMERVKQHGFVSSELERAKKKLITAIENAYNERDKQQNRSLVEEYTRHFLEAEPIPGIDWEYNYVKKDLDAKISLEQLNLLVQSYISDKNKVVDIAAPEKKEVNIPNKEEVLTLINTVQNASIDAYTEADKKLYLMKRTPKAGRIISEKTDSIFGSTEWTLSNGIRVILKPTDFKNDEINLVCFSAGGTSLVESPQDLPSAMLATGIAAQSGLAKLNKFELKEFLTGKTASASSYINTYEEGIKASATNKDLETMLQLVHLKFSTPRKDNRAFEAYMNDAHASLANAASDPRKAFGDSVSMILSDYNPRTVLLNTESLAQVNRDKALTIYKERFRNPADFTFVLVGTINIDSIKPLILSYIGGLKTKKEKENWKDNHVRYAKGEITKSFDRPMQVEKTSIYIFQWAGVPFNLANRVNFAALADILDIRYTESIRENEGGTYGVRVSASLSDQPQEQAKMSINFDTNREKADRLIELVKDELNKIAAHGPQADDLDKVKKNLIKQHHERIRENSWWLSAIKFYETDKINLASDYEKEVNKLSIESIRETLKALMNNKNFIEIRMNACADKTLR